MKAIDVHPPPTAADSFAATAGELVERVRECLEEQEFAALEGLSELERVDFYGESVTVAELARRAEQWLIDGEDVWLFALRQLHQEIGAEAGVMRVTAFLVWSPAGSWRDHDVEFDVEFRMERASGDDPWRLVDLAIETATPEVVPFPEDEEIVAGHDAGAGALPQTSDAAS